MFDFVEDNVFVSDCPRCGKPGMKDKSRKKCPFRMRCVSGMYVCKESGCGKVVWHNHPTEESEDPGWSQSYYCSTCDETESKCKCVTQQ